jgi:hypothetical protein
MITLSLLAWPTFAGKPEPLDKDFLDYLAACEGKDDNWTVVADDKKRAQAGKEVPPMPPTGKTPPTAGKAAPKPEAKP